MLPLFFSLGGRPRSCSGMPPAFRRVKTLSRAHTRTPAPQQLFVFCLHLFTHPAQDVDRLHNKGEGLGVKTGTFQVKSGNHRPITPLFSTDLPSPRRKITFTRLFAASKLGNGHLAQGKASGARKTHPYTTVIQALDQHKCLPNPPRCAAIFLGLRIGLFAAPHCAKHHSSGKRGR